MLIDIHCQIKNSNNSFFFNNISFPICNPYMIFSVIYKAWFIGLCSLDSMLYTA